MLPQNNPDRITIIFDDHRLVANAGLLLPATLALHLGLGELVDHHLNLGSAPGRANTGDKMMTLVASAPAKAGADSGHLPAQLPVGLGPPTGPGEPRVAGTGLGGWGGTRLRAVHHRLGLHHLRDLRTGQGRRATPRLYRQAGLSPAVGHGRRHRGRADGPAARGPPRQLKRRTS